MAKSVIGIFKYQDDVETALKELEGLGYKPKEMSILMKDVTYTQKNVGTKGGQVAVSAGAGAATGAILGGLTGLLVGVGAITIPGLGPLLISGPVAAALGLTGAAAASITGAAGGALAGGLLAGLVRLGIPKEQAQVYEHLIRGGGILLAVPTLEQRVAEVHNILSNNRATEIRQFNLPQVTNDFRRI